MKASRALLQALDVRPEEGRLVLLLCLHSLFIGVPRVMTTTAAMALFLAEYDAADLPFVYMAAALLIPASGFIRLRLASRLSLSQLLAVDLGFVFVVLLVFRLALLGPWLAWVALLLPIWYEVEWVILSLEFWGLAGHLLNVRQGKRLFGLIGSGELVAGGIAGFAVPTLVGWVGTPNLLLFSAGSVAGCGALLLVIARVFELRETVASEPEDRVERRLRLREFLKNRYLSLLFGLVALSYIGYYLVDNAFYKLANARYVNEDYLASFLGIFWAVTSLTSLASRALLSARVLTRYGLVGGLLALPAAIAAGVSLVTLSDALSGGVVVVFTLMALTKLFDQTLRDSVDRSAVLVLYQPLPAGQRVRAQTAVEGIVGPVAGGVAGVVLLFLLKVLRFEAAQLAALMLLVVAAWMAVALLVRREYAEVLTRALASRHLGGVALSLDDASSVAVLRKGLASDHPGEISYCLNMLEDLGHSTLETALLRLLNHRAPEVRRDALLRLERLGGRSGLERVRARLAVETDPQVRGTAIRALTALGEHEDLERALVGMDDPEPEVRLGAMVGLLRNGGIEGVLNAGERFVELSRSSRADERAFVARLIGEVGVASFYRPLMGLLGDDDMEVRRAAVSAAGRLGNPRLWPQVLASLRDPKLRSAAMAALVAGGEPVVELLESVYESAEQARDRPAQRRIVRLCCQIGGQRAMELLWRKADTADGEVRHSILSGLVLLAFEADRQARAQVQGRLEREVEQAVAVLAAIEDLGGGSADPLVIGTLEHALDRSRERVFCLLSFVHSPDSILKARVNLGSRSPEKRAQAVELIDSLLSQEQAELVVPLIEDVPHAARLGRLLGRFPQERFDAATRLRRLIDGGRLASPWMRAAAIHVAVTSGRRGMMDVVAWAATSSEALVREAAAWGLARLAPGEVKLSPEVEALVLRFVGELSGRKEGVAPMLSTVEKVIILKSVSIFSETPDEILAEVASLLQEIEVAAGEPVFEKGDMGSAMYIVVEGRVRVHSDERMLRELGPRDIFGEMAALDPEPRSASVAALVPTHLFRLEQEALYELMADRIEVVRGVIRVLCQRLRAAP